MTQKEFTQYCKNRYVILDGATGSNLMRAGMPAGVCPEQWILEHRSIMLSLQKEYVAAGSNILYAPTFTANRLKLREYGLEEKQEQMIRELVGISKEAACGKALVAGDLTMTGASLTPIGTLDFEELITIYKEQIRCLVNAGVDLLVVETMMSLQETRAALIAAKETCTLPVMTTLTFEKDGRTLYGTDAETAAVTLQSLGAAAVGVNCSAGPDRMAGLIRDMVRVTKVPIIAKPNAGMPTLLPDGTTGYSMSADVFAHDMCLLAKEGAAILGGCCGTSPEYIRKMIQALSDVEMPASCHAKTEDMYYLTSERRTVVFGLHSPLMVIGERINPTGKKKFQAELKEGSLAAVSEFADSQTQMGASVLDVNMGMPGINEKEMMLRAIEEAGSASDLPLSIDSSHVDVIEAALRRYPGRALINSISLEEAKCEALLALATKYGAMFILLPLSDAGIPANLQEKMQIISQLVDKAKSYGLGRRDFVVDGLVMTVGADPDAAKLTLQTFSKCHEMGYATVCGLSNVSFGLPERSCVNAAFLTMAVQSGLTMAIANPSQNLLMSAIYASDLLMGKEGAAPRYIEYTDALKEREAKEAAAREKAEKSQQERPMSEEQSRSLTASGERSQSLAMSKERSGSPEESALPDVLRPIYDAVLKGNRSQAAGIAEQLLAQGQTPQDILNVALMPAIDEVGVLYDRGKYFLPQLIGSAETMKSAIAVLEPVLAKEHREDEARATVIIATVKGDIHDIGKNLVALMLRNHGFDVIDLGKDVEAEEIIRAAKENKAQIIALSALMTTTMMHMKQVVSLSKQNGLTAKIMIGGAAVTQDFADEIGADGYSRDAAEAVVVAKGLLNMSGM